MNLCFAILFHIVAILLYVGFILDSYEIEDGDCQEASEDDKRRRSGGSPFLILLLVSLHSMYQLLVLSFIMQRQCRARRRKRLQPPQLSSDEEDDAEYLTEYRQRRDRSNRSDLRSINNDDQSLDETLESYELPTFPRMLPEPENRSGENGGDL